ncbi:MAG: tRNA (N(6)-L-threonylcarbamoyladenosine(37)-C(2))-methylthiotransferase MtaB [Clostridia bacterium]|nr:tRNA (N(6)-L-threonylcarbamoyladenosine(37)-C(2))-methylthiotransferase MtaB [Clostridia bacterium]
MKKVAFYTLGCKVNQYETNVMADMFKNAGYDIVEFEDVADVYVVNTCTVTNMSDRKSRQVIRRVKQVNPDSILCVVGCYAQVAKAELEKIDDIDIILGTNEKNGILQAVNQVEAEKKINNVSDVMKIRKYTNWDATAYTSHMRAEIKIQDGCDRFCTYCIIPYARGPVRSRDAADIIDEIKRIALTGVKEIVITGIHISSYGKDISKDFRLIDLLEQIDKIEGIDRIRLGSLEPLIITEDFVSRIKKLTKVCNHFHLSLQSGCDETLKRMNRRYTTEQFSAIVDLLRKEINDVALTTDIIVGFPGETDEEFDQTFEFLKKIKFSKMHVFRYSPRKGTPAATYPNQVDGNTKEARSDKLIELSDTYECEFANQYIGKEIEVLFENETEGHTTNYIKVVRDKSGDAKLETVKPYKYENGMLYTE